MFLFVKLAKNVEVFFSNSHNIVSREAKRNVSIIAHFEPICPSFLQFEEGSTFVCNFIHLNIRGVNGAWILEISCHPINRTLGMRCAYFSDGWVKSFKRAQC